MSESHSVTVEDLMAQWAKDYGSAIPRIIVTALQSAYRAGQAAERARVVEAVKARLCAACSTCAGAGTYRQFAVGYDPLIQEYACEKCVLIRALVDEAEKEE